MSHFSLLVNFTLQFLHTMSPCVLHSKTKIRHKTSSQDPNCEPRIKFRKRHVGGLSKVAAGTISL